MTRYKFVRKKHVAIMTVLDAVGVTAWYLFRLLRPWTWRRLPDAEPERVLLIRCDYIGDVLLTTHTLRAIRERFPKAEITYLTSTRGADILRHNPYLDRIEIFDPPWFFSMPRQKAIADCRRIYRAIKERRFDLALDFRGDVRNIMLLMVLPGIPRRVSFAASGGWYMLTTVAPFEHGLAEAAYHTAAARALGADVRPEDLPHIVLTDEERSAALSFLRSHGLDDGRPVIAIHPGARTQVRQWPAERYGAVARTLRERYDAHIVLVGAPDETVLIEAVNGHLDGAGVPTQPDIGSLRQLTALFEHCRLYIGVSSGPSHLAASVQLDTVLLFGPETVAQWGPIGNRSRIVQHPFPCSPCRQTDCPILEENCIMAIGVDEVLAAARELMES